MRYIGSKVATLAKLSEIIARRAPDARSFCDPFAGTCTVARHFKRLGLKIVTGDVLQLSFAFQTATIGLNREPRFTSVLASGVARREKDQTANQAVFAHLNALPGRRGYITRHFSTAGGAKRLFFTVDNAMRIDAIREAIAEWNNAKMLTSKEQLFLLAALIDGADKVANTAGTYWAHLKRLSRKAAKRINVVPLPISDNGVTNTCNLMDARELVATSDADILYLDPPYNEREYSGYYHLPETLARWDSPTPSGRSGVPKSPRGQRSDFCNPSLAESALEEVVRRTKCRYILVHYTPNGLVPHRRILSMLNSLGRTRFEDLPVRAYATHACHGNQPVMIHRIYWCRREDGAA
jgi:adenine-specific DNA-methyltransferase